MNETSLRETPSNEASYDIAPVNEMPSVSVVVPVYNGEKHLRRCIDSVFANGFEDLEILLINDGSADGSAAVMAEYEKAYPGTVRAFTHENMGVARTRNRGIESARGRYILFLDQDDWFDHDYIQTFFEAIEKSGSDVVVGGYKRPDASGKIVLSRLLPVQTVNPAPIHSRRNQTFRELEILINRLQSRSAPRPSHCDYSRGRFKAKLPRSRIKQTVEETLASPVDSRIIHRRTDR